MNKRPTNEELAQDFERLDPSSEQVDCRSFVMRQIDEGRARMRSRWIVLTEYLGLRTTWVILILTVIAIVNINLYILSRTPEWAFVDFGPSAFWLVFSNLPYGWWALAFVLMVIALVAMKRFSIAYIWPFHLFALFTVMGIFSVSAVAFASGMNDHLYKRLVEDPEAGDSFLARIYCLGANRAIAAKTALVGEVMDVTPYGMVVQTPQLDVVTVLPTEDAPQPDFREFKKFQVVKMIGRRDHDLFWTTQIKADPETELSLNRDHEDCKDKSRFAQKQELLQKRREAVKQPFTPVFGAAQLIRNVY